MKAFRVIINETVDREGLLKALEDRTEVKWRDRSWPTQEKTPFDQLTYGEDPTLSYCLKRNTGPGFCDACNLEDLCSSKSDRILTPADFIREVEKLHPREVEVAQPAPAPEEKPDRPFGYFYIKTPEGFDVAGFLQDLEAAADVCWRECQRPKDYDPIHPWGPEEADQKVGYIAFDSEQNGITYGSSEKPTGTCGSVIKAIFNEEAPEFEEVTPDEFIARCAAQYPYKEKGGE